MESNFGGGALATSEGGSAHRTVLTSNEVENFKKWRGVDNQFKGLVRSTRLAETIASALATVSRMEYDRVL